MSNNCEDIRPLIAELVYGEVDSDVAEKVREHLGTCLSCRRHQMAFLAVRKDLQEWQPEATHEPRGTTFIAPAAHVATPLWSSRIFQGFAMAAAFFFAAFLMAAVVNLQVESGPDGWAFSTSLWDAPAGLEQAPDETLRTNNPATQAPVEPQLASIEEIPDANEWLEQRLAASGFVRASDMPDLTDAQWEQISNTAWEIFDAGIAERDAQADQRVLDLVAASEARQSDTFFMALGAVANDLTADRRDELDELVQQLGVVYVDTDRRLGQVNTRIDTLANQVAPSSERQDPER